MCGLLCGCEREDIHAYRAPKTVHMHTHDGEGAASNAKVAWTLPAGWESIASDQPMRLATFRPGAGMPEIALSAFPGDAGGLLANINRWRGQIGLAAMDEPQLAQAVELSETGAVKVALVDFAADGGQRMLGAVVVPGDGQTWFVKSTGPAEAIGKVKADFAAFARSFRLEAPASAPGGSDQVMARLTSWTPPTNWKADPNASSIVAAAYNATNADGVVKVTVTMLMNDGGGLLPNINRWRDQLGLPPVEKVEQQPIKDLGAGCMLVELTAADGSNGMNAAIVGSSGQTWYFKMTGPPKGIEAERAQFERMIRVVGLGERAQ